MHLARVFKRFRRGYGISLLVPYRKTRDPYRSANWDWLQKYWKTHLPGAEIVIGQDDGKIPFSKSEAVNDAVAKSHGDVLVVIDADAYIPYKTILECAKRIREARKRGQKLWFVPYRRLYRLTKEATHRLLASSPKIPMPFSSPPDHSCVLTSIDSQKGHWYGAMLQVAPKEAFLEVGGWDERFRGWGGEDHSAMRAMDTLYWKHKTLPIDILHLWHPMISPTGTAAWVEWKERMWENQEKPGENNSLAGKFYAAYRNPVMMRQLLSEGKVDGHHKDRRKRHRLTVHPDYFLTSQDSTVTGTIKSKGFKYPLKLSVYDVPQDTKVSLFPTIVNASVMGEGKSKLVIEVGQTPPGIYQMTLLGVDKSGAIKTAKISLAVGQTSC